MKPRSLNAISLLLILMIAWTATGCSSKKEPAPNESKPVVEQEAGNRTIVDMTGKSVVIPTPDKIERVAVLTSPLVQIMYILGVQDKLCAMTASQYRYKLFEKFYPRQASIPAPRQQAADMNVEALLQSNPQFCIGSEIDMDLVDKTTEIPTVRISTNDNPADVFKTRKTEVQMFGNIFGAQEKADKYCQYLDNTLASLNERVGSIPQDKKLKVYMGFGADHLTTYGGDTYMQYQIAAAGCENAAREVSTLGGKEGGLANVSMEHLLKWNPDIVVIDTGNLDELRQNPSWAKINAVKNGRVYLLPVGGFIWNRPSCESAVLLPLWLGIKAYPDKFQDVSIEEEIKRYWQEILGFSLSEEDVNGILNPPPMPFGGGGTGGGPQGGKGGK